MLVPASRERFDGIRDYAVYLASALAPEQRCLLLTTRDDMCPPVGSRVLAGWGHLVRGDAPRVLYLHYQPVSWLRRDLPALIRALAKLRDAGTRVIVIFHEYQLDAGPSLRRAGARAVFRRLARAIARDAHALVATYGFVAEGLKEDGPGGRAPIAVIAVGSNIAPCRPAPDAGARTPNAVVMFGQPAGMAPVAVRAAAAALRDAGKPPLRWVCRDGDEALRWLRGAGVPDGSVMRLPSLEAPDVSRELSSASVALAPNIDGVSTRRGTVAACLQHGLPMVGTGGRATDPVFSDSPAFLLAPPGDGPAVASGLLDVLGDAGRRQRMSAEAIRLFDAHLAWPRIARRYVELLR
jgi:glycosyltransferase involved in cell wall biosynthesis